MIQLSELTKRLEAKVQLDATRLPMSTDTASFLIKVLAPFFMEIVREQIADAKRDWLRRKTQQ